MAWPANQNLIPATFAQRRPQQQKSSLTEKVKRQQSYGTFLEREQAPIGTGLGAAFGGGGLGDGIELEAGLQGSARVVESWSRDAKGKGGAGGSGSGPVWEWAWVRDRNENVRLTRDAKETVLFPATIAPNPTTSPLTRTSSGIFPRRRTRSMVSLSNTLASKLGMVDDVVMDETIQRIIQDEFEEQEGTPRDRGRRNKIPRMSSLHRSASSNNIPDTTSLEADTDSLFHHKASPALLTDGEVPPTRARSLVTHHETRQAEEVKALENGHGQRLVAIKWEMGSLANTAEEGTALFLGFPMGINAEDLNLSYYKTWPEGPKQVPTFMPTHKPCLSFPTPILQISASDAVDVHDAHKYLAVRLYASTRIISLQLPTTFRSTRKKESRSRHHPPNSEIPLALEFDNITLDRTGGSRHVDVAMHPFKRGYAVLVDREGRVWIWEKVEAPDRHHSGRFARELRCIQEREEAGSDGFWRVAWGVAAGSVIVAGTNCVDLISVNGDTQSTRRILDLTNQPSTIITIATDTPSRSGRYLCVTTSTHVAWIDESVDTNPIMMWKHHRSNVPDLRTLSVIVQGGSATLLFAPPWSAMTCFTVNEGSTVVESALDPYYIPATDLRDGTFSSALVVNIPGYRLADKLLVTLASDGRLQGSVLRGGWVEPPGQRLSAISVQWSKAIKELQNGPDNQEDDGADVEKASFQSLWADLQWAIFGTKERVLDTAELKHMLEEQEDLANKGLLTMLETVALACDNPDREDRGAIFLRGFTSKDADTSIDATTHVISLIDSLIKNVAGDDSRLDRSTKSLGKLRLGVVEQETLMGPDAEYRSGLNPGKDLIARRLVEVRTAYARKRLLLDLRLSSSLLGGPEDPAESPQVDLAHDLVAIAARLQIDLAEPKPDFKFHLLKPKPSWKGAGGIADADKDEAKVLDRRSGATTIQSLLGGWDIGSDPSDFVWVSPRGPGEELADGQRVTLPPTSRLPQPSRQYPYAVPDHAQTQPAILHHAVSFASQPPRMAGLPSPAPNRAMSPEAGSYPSDLPNTQSVPGRFGSRMGGGRMTSSSQGLARKRAFGF